MATLSAPPVFEESSEPLAPKKQVLAEKTYRDRALLMLPRHKIQGPADALPSYAFPEAREEYPSFEERSHTAYSLRLCVHAGYS